MELLKQVAFQQNPIRVGNSSNQVKARDPDGMRQPAEQKNNTEGLEKPVHTRMICDCGRAAQDRIGAAESSISDRARWLLWTFSRDVRSVALSAFA